MVGEGNSEEGWVVCRVFKKKNYHKAHVDQSNSQNSMMDLPEGSLIGTSKDGILDRILVYMGRSSCKQENPPINNIHDEDDVAMQFINNNPIMSDDKFMHLPRLENPLFNQHDCSSFSASQPSMNDIAETNSASCTTEAAAGLSDWVALDRLVASQLNGQEEVFCFPAAAGSIRSHGYHHQPPQTQAYEGAGSELDFWTFARSSSSDPLCRLSV